MTGTVEDISHGTGPLVGIKLVGDDNTYLMPGPITATLHREQSHFMAVMKAEFVAHPDDPDNPDETTPKET